MKRENKALILGIILIYILILQLVVLPNRQRGVALRAEADQLKSRLAGQVDVRAVLAEKGWMVNLLRKEQEAAALLPVIEERVSELELSGRLKTVVPVTQDLGAGVRAEGFDLRLEDLSLREAVLLLELLQQEPSFYLDRFALEKSRDQRYVSLRARILTIRKRNRE